MAIENLTLLFLVLVFALAEVWALTRGLRGVMVGFCDEAPPMLRLADRRVRVRLADGSFVAARVSGCTACMNRLAVGDAVSLLRQGAELVVAVPWGPRRCPGSVKEEHRD